MRLFRLNSWKALIAVLAFAVPGVAQLQIGQDVSMNLSGDVAAGYGSSIGGSPSSHNLMFGGSGQLTGFYYHPNFLNFSVAPYVDRDQSNSTSAVSDSNSGVNTNVNLFSGSHFPGNFTYHRENNSSQVYGLAGSDTGLISHGSGQGWTLAWSALLPKLPSLNVGVGKSSGSSAVDGANTESSSNNRTFTLNSNYSIAGFAMAGNYTNLHTSLTPPRFLAEVDSHSESHMSSLGFNISHRLPLSGNAMFTASRTAGGADFSDQSSNAVDHQYSASGSITPFSRMTMTMGASYTDNLSAMLNNQLLATNSTAPYRLDFQTDSLLAYTSVGLYVARGFSVAANASRTVQHWAGAEHASERFSGTASYNFSHRFLGALTVSGGVVDTATKYGNSGSGLIGNVNFERKFGAWQMGARFSYSQDIQSLVGVSTTSSYNYGSNFRRRFGRIYWSGSFSGAHSGIQIGNTSSHTESISSALTLSTYGINGSWGQSTGISVLSANGLVPLSGSTSTELLSPEMIILFSSGHFSLGATGSPKRKMLIVANYFRSSNSTIAGLKSSAGDTSLLKVRITYKFRKMNMNAGYSRITQSIYLPGSLPVVSSSFYFGLSRWFNFF